MNEMKVQDAGKDTDTHVKVLKNQLKFKKQGLEGLNKLIPRFESFIDFKKMIMGIDYEVSEITTRDYQKIGEPTYKYEEDSRFQELMQDKQKILNMKTEITDDIELEKLEKSLKDALVEKEKAIESIEQIKKEITEGE